MNSEKFVKAKSRLNELSYTQVKFNENVVDYINGDVSKEINSFLDSKIIDAAKELIAAADDKWTVADEFKVAVKSLNDLGIVPPTLNLVEEGNKND